MKLDKKKNLAAKTFNVGKYRIAFVEPRLSEIKEAITKADLKSLKDEGVIIIKEIKGRKKKQNKKRKSPGNVKKTLNTRKRDYVIMTRKLRKYVADMKKKDIISKEQAKEIRKKIRNKDFRNQAQLKDYINNLKK